MEQIAYKDTDGPRDVLERTLRAITTFLGKLFRDPKSYGLTYHVEIAEDLIAGYDETLAHNLEPAVHNIRGADDERLITTGFTGPALRAKVNGLNGLSRAVKAGVRKAIGWLLSLINSILGSLGTFTIFVDAIKEAKDLFEATTDFVTDDG